MITLTHDQQNAMNAFIAFLTDPVETVFVLSGYSGTGKTTLVKTLLDKLPDFLRTAKLINPKVKNYDVELTATTNKAAENFAYITGSSATTIHSFLGLRVQTDYATNTTKLLPSKNTCQERKLLFIDEASYVDKHLLSWIFKLTRDCKIVFMGDPAQLTPVKSTGTPVFDANFTGAALSQVVRQAEGNPIVDLSTRFRETVSTGEFFQFHPDGQHIQVLDRKDFLEAIEAEFSRPDWVYHDSKVLGWTNKRVTDYNHHINTLVKGTPTFQVGDYAVCNKFITLGRRSIKTDQMVCISQIESEVELHGVKGRYISVDNGIRAFLPNQLADKNALIKKARAAEYTTLVEEVESQWFDLRAAYACTINKAQGSTFERVFIDLDDISRCNSGDQIARMLYVAVSRARKQVFLTGDLV